MCQAQVTNGLQLQPNTLIYQFKIFTAHGFSLTHTQSQTKTPNYNINKETLNLTILTHSSILIIQSTNSKSTIGIHIMSEYPSEIA